MNSELKPKRAPSVVCPHCGKMIDPAAVQGTWLERRCPKCREFLSGRQYDTRARDLLDLRALERARTQREKGLATRRAKSADRIESPLLEPLRIALRKSSRWHAARSAKAAKRVAAIQGNLDQLALGRYYTSEWYLCSGCMLEGADAHASYAMTAKYDDAARLRLRCLEGGPIVGGILGERAVFDALLARVLHGRGLEGARLAPNAFLPSMREEGSGLADQTDLIVLAREAVFVLEVKNWRSHIAVTKNGGELKIDCFKDVGHAKPDERDGQKAVTQISRRMDDLVALGLYPENRVFGVVVFVDPLSIDMPHGKMGGNVFVATCCSDGSGTLVSALESRVKGAEGIFSCEEVDAMAQAILANWTDRTGELQREQNKIRKAMLVEKRQAHLVALADFSVERKQARYQKREEHGRKREETKSKARKSKAARSQRHARMKRIYKIESEYDEWDYRAC